MQENYVIDPVIKMDMTLTPDNVLIIQPTEYVENSWHIEIYDNEITLYRIPLFEGHSVKIGTYNDLISALRIAQSLNEPTNEEIYEQID